MKDKREEAISNAYAQGSMAHLPPLVNRRNVNGSSGDTRIVSMLAAKRDQSHSQLMNTIRCLISSLFWNYRSDASADQVHQQVMPSGPQSMWSSVRGVSPPPTLLQWHVATYRLQNMFCKMLAIAFHCPCWHSFLGGASCCMASCYENRFDNVGLNTTLAFNWQ